jgi:hypothetical protein
MGDLGSVSPFALNLHYHFADSFHLCKQGIVFRIDNSGKFE